MKGWRLEAGDWRQGQTAAGVFVSSPQPQASSLSPVSSLQSPVSSLFGTVSRWILICAVIIGLAVPAPARQRKAGRTKGLATETATAGAPGQITREGRYWVEEVSGSVPAAPRVRVVSAEGAIEFRGGPQSEISYRVRKRLRGGRNEEEARRRLAEYRLRVRRSGDSVELAMESAEGQLLGAEFFVTAPRATAQAYLETRGGHVVVEGIDGEAVAETAGGSIRADQIGGAARLETAGGSVTIGRVGGKVQAETAGGSIQLQSCGAEAIVSTQGGSITVGSCEKGVRAETAGGSIEIGKAGGDVEAQTAGGSIHVGEARGKVKVQTSAGSITVDSAAGPVDAATAAGGIRLWKVTGPVRAETTAGNITAQVVADRRFWAESLLETTMGDVIVYLPEQLPVTIRATIEMARGRDRITSDFPLNIHASGESPWPREILAEGQLNGGGAPLRIHTTAGNIEIRKNK